MAAIIAVAAVVAERKRMRSSEGTEEPGRASAFKPIRDDHKLFERIEYIFTAAAMPAGSKWNFNWTLGFLTDEINGPRYWPTLVGLLAIANTKFELESIDYQRFLNLRDQVYVLAMPRIKPLLDSTECKIKWKVGMETSMTVNDLHAVLLLALAIDDFASAKRISAILNEHPDSNNDTDYFMRFYKLYLGTLHE